MTSESVDKIRDAFLDRHIIIYLKDMQVTMPSDDGTVSVAAMVEGYLCDVDDYAYYLGLEDGTILQVIPHHATGPVELATKTMEDYSNIFENMPDDTELQ